MDELDRWLDRVYQAGGDRQALDAAYDEWAKDYDQHIWSSGNPYITVTSGMIGRHLPDKAARILDAGCGTGNMAQILTYLGYTNIEGLDPSPGMLVLAERKGIYCDLHRTTLGASIDLPDETYDAVVAAGVLTDGHAPPESLDGIVKILKPGGLIVFSLSKTAGEHSFNAKMAELEQRNAWRAVDRSTWFRTYPFSEHEAHIRHAIFAFRKT